MDGTIRRVALVSMHTPPAQQAGTGDSGGLNVSLLATAHELAARGVEVDLLTRADGEPTVTEVGPGVIVRALAAGPPGRIDKGDLPELTDEFGEAVATLAGRHDSRYDLIHAHYWLSGIATLPVALELHVPFVQTFHTLAAMKNRHRRADHPVEPDRRHLSEAYLAGQASAVIAVSSAEVECLIDDLRAPADRLWVVPPGVDTQLFRPDRPGAAHRVRAAYGIDEGRPLLAAVGRLQPLKGHELSIRALAHLQSLREWVPTLVIAGDPTPGDEGHLHELRTLADELGVGDDVRFVGALNRDDLADLLTTATLTLMPSHSETFGLVALESAASGTPVVGFRSTGLTESVVDGGSGVLIPERDPRVWATVINRLLRDPVERAVLSAGAREHALGHTWAATATATLGLYGGLVESRRGR